jgi:hypothetical protein
MLASEIEARLSAMGFVQVDAVRGLYGDVKWRHLSALHRGGGLGSVWVEDGSINATGVRKGGYRLVLSKFHRPTSVKTELRNPYAAWRGLDIDALLTAMEQRITPSTVWPPD